MIDIQVLAKIVAAAGMIVGEIREAVKARGEEAQRLFEEAVRRNEKSLADLIAEAGGSVPAEPTPPPPPIYDPSLYDQRRPLPVPEDAELKVAGFKAGDKVYETSTGAWYVLPPAVLQYPGSRLVRIVQ